MKLRREYVRGGETVVITAELIAGDLWRVRVGDRTLDVTALPIGDGGVRLVTTDGDAPRSTVAFGASAGKQFMVRVDGRTFTLAPPAGRGREGSFADGIIRAPMTGTVLEVHCQDGDRVTAEQTLVVLSAMKMEHKLAAGIAGTVRKVAAATGATVEQGAELVIVEPDPAETETKEN